jgi:hypothetical protein
MTKNHLFLEYAVSKREEFMEALVKTIESCDKYAAYPKRKDQLLYLAIGFLCILQGNSPNFEGDIEDLLDGDKKMFCKDFRQYLKDKKKVDKHMSML